MAEYSVLYHQMPANGPRRDHYDLLLVRHGRLATWEIASWPPNPLQSARQLPDHRLLYLNYEGPVEPDRGVVNRVCQGHYQTLHQQPQLWRIEIQGLLFRGQIELRQVHPTQPRDWTLAAQLVGDED